MTMNHYGVAARAYWRRWLPERYADLPDPAAFFTELGERVEQQVGDVWDHLISEDRPPADETHLERVGRLGQLKAQAEHEVMAELVRLEPEPAALTGGEGDGEDDGLESETEFEERTRRARERTEWLAATADGLVDGTVRLEDLDDAHLRQVLDYLTPAALGLVGTSVAELRARGRQV